MADAADSTSPPDVGESSKTVRKQGVSCDACKFRKVKCDRRTKIENRQGDESEDNIACSVCSSHGLRCTYTQSAPRRRRGKRIVAIQKVQSNDVDEVLAIRSLQQSSPTNNPYEPLFGSDVMVNEGMYDASTYASNNLQTSDASKTYAPPEGLLGVRGLSRPLLDACVKSYFKYAAPCTPILHAEVYAARYALFFAQYDKHRSARPFWELPQEDAQSVDRPLSELLLLSVGCIGASLLEPPIADFGSKAKFRLQDRLALKFQETVNKHDLLLRLQHEGTDVIEACYIMSDPMLTVLGDELPSRSTIDWDSIRQMDKSQRDPLRLRPASHEGIVRLIFKMGLNQNPKDRMEVLPGDDRLWHCEGAFVNEREVFRRSRIFWSIFIQDSFRSMAERRNVLIGNDDYDLDLPRFIPDGDGWFTGHFFDKSKDLCRWEILLPKNGNVQRLKASKFAKFDAYHFEVMLRLAFIIRTVSIKFVSARSRSKGVLVSDVERAVGALTAWYQQLPSEVTWEYQSEPLLSALHEGKTGSSNATAMRNSLRALFVETLFHSNVLAVWASVDAFGTRNDVELIEAVSLLATRLKIDDDGGVKSPEDPTLSKRSSNPSSASTIPETPPSGQKTTDEVRNAVKHRLYNLNLRSFLRVSKVVKEAARLGLVRGHRLVFVNVTCSYAIWGCGLACKLSANGAEGLGEGANALLADLPPGYNHIEYIFKRVEDLIFAVGAVDSCEQAQEKVTEIRELLQKSRASCRASSQDGSRRSSSTTSSQSPYNATSEDPDAASPHDAPFRYYFQTRGKGGPIFDRSKVLAKPAANTAPRGIHETTAAAMDMDEVAMLAHAAIPYDTGFHIEGPSPASDTSFKSGDTPEANKAGITQNVNLDLDLESISGMDANWLHQYLQSGVPTSDAASMNRQPQELNNAPYYGTNPPASTGGDVPPAQFYNTETFPPPDATQVIAAEAAPSTTGAGIDTQWDQFMANADAQLWADAQWQGFNMDTLMT